MPRTTYKLDDATDVRVEDEEDGWELVIETGSGAVVRINVHALATTGELDDQLRKALDTIRDWKAAP